MKADPLAKASKDNAAVLAGLADTFVQLNASRAIVGRAGRLIVIDFMRVPALIQQELGNIFSAAAVRAPNGYGCASVFESVQVFDDAFVFLSVSDGLEMEPFCGFPHCAEIRDLLQSPPALPPGDVKRFEALSAEMRAELNAFLSENRDEIVAALFGGSDQAPVDEDQPPSLAGEGHQLH